MRLTVSTNPVPPGRYLAELTGIRHTNRGTFGPGLRFEFTICGGPLQGRKISRMTGCIPGPTNALGSLLRDLLGRPLQIGEEIDVDPLINREYSIEVALSESGASYVETAKSCSP